MFGFIMTMLGLVCMCGAAYCAGMIKGIRRGQKALQAAQNAPKVRIQTKAEIDRDLQEAWAEVEREFPTCTQNGKV